MSAREPRQSWRRRELSRRSTQRSTEAGGKTPQRWWNTFTKTIVGLGALASAIAAIMSLWPSPDVADSASLSSVRVVEMPVSEYVYRSTTLTPRSQGLPGRTEPPAAGLSMGLSATRVDVAFGVGRVESQDSPTPATPEPPTSTVPPASPTKSGPPTSEASPTVSAPFELPPMLSRADQLAVAEEVLRRMPNSVPGGFTDLLSHAVIITDKGKGVKPGDAVDRVVSLLGESRTVGGRSDGKVEPLGVLVSANVELVGLRGRPILLSWSVLKESGAAPLPETWRTSMFGYQLRATSEHDTGTVDIWVPMPKAPGQYLVRLTLSTEDARLTSADSPNFG